jgi:hypothetical protein
MVQPFTLNSRRRGIYNNCFFIGVPKSVPVFDSDLKGFGKFAVEGDVEIGNVVLQNIRCFFWIGNDAFYFFLVAVLKL